MKSEDQIPDYIIQSLRSVAPDVATFAIRHQQQAQQNAEFERLAMKIQYNYHLDRAYSLDEIKQACSGVCARYGDPGLRTLGILEAQMDTGVTRRFFIELAKVTQL